VKYKLFEELVAFSDLGHVFCFVAALAVTVYGTGTDSFQVWADHG
jgi:hypothetical protein